MFAKLYRYKIRAQDLDRWKENNDKARKVYAEQGHTRSVRLWRQDGDTISVVELDLFDSQEAREAIAGRVDADPRIAPLFEEFKSLLVDGHVEEEFSGE